MQRDSQDMCRNTHEEKRQHGQGRSRAEKGGGDQRDPDKEGPNPEVTKTPHF